MTLPPNDSSLDRTLDTAPTTNSQITQAAELLSRVREETQKVVVGQHEVTDHLLIALVTSGHVLLEGVPGLGKTLMVQALAKTFSGEFSRIQFTPDLMPADITGHMLYNPQKSSFNYRKGPIFTNLLLADEINRAPAKTQSALLEVMQEKTVTVEGKAMSVGRPFMVLATQNPLEQEGTYPLPEAQLDRFLMKVVIDHLAFDEEKQLMMHILGLANPMQINVDDVSPVMSPQHLLGIQRVLNAIIVDDRVVNYALEIVRLTREFSGIAIGSGPRGAIALLACARAKALLSGRAHVIPDDVKALTLPILRHRIALTAEVEIEGMSTDDLLIQLLNSVQAPRQ